MGKSGAFIAQTVVVVLGTLGVTLESFPQWLRAVIALGVIAATIVYQWQHHATVRTASDNRAAVELKQAKASEAASLAQKAQDDRVRAEVQLQTKKAAVPVDVAFNSVPPALLAQPGAIQGVVLSPEAHAQMTAAQASAQAVMSDGNQNAALPPRS